MKIEYQNNYIYIKDKENEAGYIRYHFINEYVIDVTTTFVHENYRGQGIASQLFEALVQLTKENHYKIIPSCSYIKKMLEKSTEYQNIYYYC